MRPPHIQNRSLHPTQKCTPSPDPDGVFTAAEVTSTPASNLNSRARTLQEYTTKRAPFAPAHHIGLTASGLSNRFPAVFGNPWVARPVAIAAGFGRWVSVTQHYGLFDPPATVAFEFEARRRTTASLP